MHKKVCQSRNMCHTLFLLVGTHDIRTQFARAQPARARACARSVPVPMPSPCLARPSQTDRLSELIYMIFSMKPP